jgi:hypothetical protein
MAAQIKWCDNGGDHAAPFYTVTLLAVEGGPGTRKRGGNRRIARLTLRRLCKACLKATEFRPTGAQLLSRLGVGRAED